MNKTDKEWLEGLCCSWAGDIIQWIENREHKVIVEMEAIREGAECNFAREELARVIKEMRKQ